MNASAWHAAQQRLAEMLAQLPHQNPRDETWFNPQDLDQLSAWRHEETTRRPRIDQMIRAWITHGHLATDPEFDTRDEYLLWLRLKAANHYLELGRHNLLTPDLAPAIILQTLLIDAWPDYFLSDHTQQLFYRVTAYRRGLQDAQSRSFPT